MAWFQFGWRIFRKGGQTRTPAVPESAVPATYCARSSGLPFFPGDYPSAFSYACGCYHRRSPFLLAAGFRPFVRSRYSRPILLWLNLLLPVPAAATGYAHTTHTIPCVPVLGAVRWFAFLRYVHPFFRAFDTSRHTPHSSVSDAGRAADPQFTALFFWFHHRSAPLDFPVPCLPATTALPDGEGGCCP